MRIIGLSLIMALAACSGPAPANPGDHAEAAAQSPAEQLAAQVKAAIEAGDIEAFRGLHNFAGTDDAVRSVFDRFAPGIVGRKVNAVTLEPLGDAVLTEQFNSTSYRFNGEPVGQITVDFAMDNPNEKETFSMVYGIEAGRAVILRMVPEAE